MGSTPILNTQSYLAVTQVQAAKLAKAIVLHCIYFNGFKLYICIVAVWLDRYVTFCVSLQLSVKESTIRTESRLLTWKLTK